MNRIKPELDIILWDEWDYACIANGQAPQHLSTAVCYTYTHHTVRCGRACVRERKIIFIIIVISRLHSLAATNRRAFPLRATLFFVNRIFYPSDDCSVSSYEKYDVLRCCVVHSVSRFSFCFGARVYGTRLAVQNAR